MGYISAKQGEGFIVSATKGLWLYWVIAVPLVVLTMGSYIVYEMLRLRLRCCKQRSDTHSAKAIA